MWKNRYKGRGIQRQLLFRLLLILIIMLTILGYYQHENMKSYLYQSKIEFLDSRFKELDENIIIDTKTSSDLNERIDIILREISTEDICVVVIDKDGKVIGSKNKYTGINTSTSIDRNKIMSIPILDNEEYKEILSKKGLSNEYRILKDPENKEQIVIFRQIGELSNPIGLVQISTYINIAQTILLEQTKVYFLAAFIVLIIGIILSLAVLKHTLKPLKKMSNKLDKIDIEQLNIRLNEETGLIEIDKLANTFNNTFDRLETSFKKEKRTNEKMKNFILDVSHELRTPLTSIQGFIEVLQMGAYKDEKKLNFALSSILNESERLSKLVNKLLILTKLEDEEDVLLNKENLGEIIEELLPQLQVLVKERKLEIDLEDNIISMVNKDQIKQVIYNLVQNAINYTENHSGKIKISVKKSYKNNIDYGKIVISDNGIGISKENLEKIFDRFYRCDKHRDRKKGGYGLGLSIVKQIIDNHGGEVDVNSEQGKGTDFIVYLKLANPMY